jgi:hypothetical protein
LNEHSSFTEIRIVTGKGLPRDEAVAGTDGDGRMIGWILVYASVVIVLAALALWERSP